MLAGLADDFQECEDEKQREELARRAQEVDEEIDRRRNGR